MSHYFSRGTQRPAILHEDITTTAATQPGVRVGHSSLGGTVELHAGQPPHPMLMGYTCCAVLVEELVEVLRGGFAGTGSSYGTAGQSGR